MKRIIQFAKDELHIKELDGQYAKVNPASGNVLRKLGFQYLRDVPYDCNNDGIPIEGIQCKLYL